MPELKKTTPSQRPRGQRLGNFDYFFRKNGSEIGDVLLRARNELDGFWT
jgi:hypothetical protein